MNLQLADWLSLMGHFMMFSLIAISGAITVVPEMHRYLVDETHWLTDLQFSSSIAIAQAAPGPNILFVAVMGFQVADLAGTAATMLGILLPSTTLAMAVSRFGRSREDWLPVRAFRQGMAPMTIALMLSAAWVLTSNLAPNLGSVTTGRSALIIAALSIAAALISWRTKVHVLVLIGMGAVVGIFALS